MVAIFTWERDRPSFNGVPFMITAYFKQTLTHVTVQRKCSDCKNVMLSDVAFPSVSALVLTMAKQKLPANAKTILYCHRFFLTFYTI